MTVRAQPPLTVYRPRRPLTAMLGVAGIIILVMLVFVVSEGLAMWQVPAVLGGAGLISLLMIEWINRRARLEVNNAGMAYIAPGFCVSASWDNLAGYGKRTLGVETVEVLLLRQPGMELAPALSLGQKLLPFLYWFDLFAGRVPPKTQMDDYADVIPVGLFANNWRESELGRLVQRHAPAAFAKEIAEG